MREAQGSKFALREKWVLLVEQLLRGYDAASLSPPGQDPSVFYDGLFLLKVNSPFLQQQLAALSVDALVKPPIITSIRSLVSQAILRLSDPSPVRMRHALEMLIGVMVGVLSKKFPNYGTDVVEVLVGLREADVQMGELLRAVDLILQGSNGTPLAMAASYTDVLYCRRIEGALTCSAACHGDRQRHSQPQHSP